VSPCERERKSPEIYRNNQKTKFHPIIAVIKISGKCVKENPASGNDEVLSQRATSSDQSRRSSKKKGIIKATARTLQPIR
jgi:hypothetical protein